MARCQICGVNFSWYVVLQNERIRDLFGLPADERIDQIILRDNLEVEGSVGEANLDTALGSDLVQEIQNRVTSFMKSLARGEE